MKRSYIILITVIVLAGLILFVERSGLFSRGDFKQFLLYPGINVEDVSGIEVVHLLDGSGLVKSDGVWQVREIETKMRKVIREKEGGKTEEARIYRADSEKAEKVLREIGRLKAQSLASNNPERRNLYQVGEIAKHVVLYGSDGKKLAELYVGKNGPDIFTTYVRRGGEDEVYIVEKNIGAEIPADVFSWRDKTIWEIDPDQIVEVGVTRGKKGSGRSYKVSKEGGAWYLAEPSKGILDNEKVTDFIERLGKVVASRFAMNTAGQEKDFLEPSLEISVKTEDGKTRTLLVGGKEGQGYLFARLKEGGGDLYLVDSDLNTHIPADWPEFAPNPANIDK